MHYIEFGEFKQFSPFKIHGDNRFSVRKMSADPELDDLMRKFTPPTRAQSLAMSHTVLEAMYEYVTGLCFEGHDLLGFGKTKEGDICVCYKRDTNDKEQYVKIPFTKDSNIAVMACEVDSSGTWFKYDHEKHKGRAVLLALLMFSLEKYEDFRDEFTRIKDIVAHIKEDSYFDFLTKEDNDRICAKLAILTSFVYYKTKYHAPDAMVPFTSMLQLKDTELTSTTVTASSAVGEIKGFAIEKVAETVVDPEAETAPKKRGRKKKVAEAVSENLKGMFSIASRKLSKLEEDMIPKMASWYVCPNWVKNTCEDIKDSEIFSQRIRNVLLAGPAGTGKTKGVQAMASALGLPYVKITCSPDTEIFDFIGQMLPSTSAEEDETDFQYVKTDLIRAIENGWVCEIQEPTVIKRSSVLVGLNAILENDEETSFITLPTGEVIRRHPDCVIVMTTNSSYDGCKAIQQSVLSRMDLVREVAAPTEDILVERAKAQTGFDDETLLRKMVSTITRINEFSEKNDITDGICGPRELYAWAKKSLLQAKREEHPVEESDVIKASFTTVLSKMAQDPEDREALINGVFSTVFLNTLVDKYNKAYLVGDL